MTAVVPQRLLRGTPRWVAIVLGLVVLFAALVSSWNLAFAGTSPFYSTAARSMSESWRAFAFGALDPGGSVTLDKLSGFLIPQALSARLFGFHAWSISLPQAIEGMVTVAAAYVVATRWRDYRVGLLAAVATATTPLFASMFGHVMEDGLLTMSLALALLCWQSSVLSGRMLPLLLAALWVAVGFQAKMMQAWIILPALAIGYLLAAPHPLLVRIRRVLITGVIAAVLSLSWMTAIQLVPAADRPYIDGSTNNTTYSMVFGYNGFNRIIPNLVPGAVGDRPASYTSQHPSVQHLAPIGDTAAQPGDRIDKLVVPYYLTQIGWLYPLALGGIVLGLVRLRRHGVDDSPPATADRTERATVVTLGVWLATGAALLTVARIPHTAYMAAIGFQLAMLAAIGLAQAIRLHRAGVPFVLPVLVLVQVAWTAVVLLTFARSPFFVLPAVLVLGVGSALVLVIRRRAGRLVLTTAVAATLFAPTVWTLWTLSVSDEGSAGDAYAGPRFDATEGASPKLLADQQQWLVGAPFRSSPDQHLTAAQADLVGYLRPRRPSAGPLLTTEIWGQATPYILDAGLDVAPMGGFSGQVPHPTIAQLAGRQASGSLRFVLLESSGPRADAGAHIPFGMRVLHSSHSFAAAAWVRGHCAPVPQTRFETGGHRLFGEDLYDCGGG
jgi:4-amino-4-deoxy-L-arabinose transferase-like glycosyltransferase